MQLVPSIRGLPRTFWILWIGTLINRLGSFIVPFLGLYLTEERHLSIETVGVIVSLFGAGSATAALVGGFLADRIGRKRTMALGLCLGAISMTLLAFAREPAWIAVTAFVLGATGDLYRPAVIAAITDLVEEKDRGRAYGLLYWAINLGFAIAPVLAGFLARYRYELLFFGDAATSFTFGLIVALRVPETRPSATHARPIAIADALTPFRDPKFLLFGLATFIVAVVFQQSMISLPLDMRAHGLSTETYGALIALNGAGIVVLQPFAVVLVERFRRDRVLVTSAVLTGLGFGLPALLQSVPAYAVSILIWTLGEIIMSPVAPAVVSDLAPRSLRGTYQGAFHMFWGASSLSAPMLGTQILERFGATALWTGSLAVAGVAAVAYSFVPERATPR